jgi:hypothetical protein
MKLLITTQVRENYAAHDWDGEGQCPVYWKNKGGNEYVVLHIDISRAGEIFQTVSDQCQEKNVYFEEYVLGWEVVSNNYMTDYELSQLEYDGEIRYPAKVLNCPLHKSNTIPLQLTGY